MSMPDDSSAALWQACLDVMAQEVPAQQFATWLQPLQLQPRPAAEGLALAVGNRFKLDWIRAQYLQRLIEVAEQLAGQPTPIELVIAPRTPATVQRSTAQTILGTLEGRTLTGDIRVTTTDGEVINVTI